MLAGFALKAVAADGSVVLQSYGDVQTLYTGTKAQGKVMVTFYDSMAASKAYAALSGRTVNGRTLKVDFHHSQKDAQSGTLQILAPSFPCFRILAWADHGCRLLINPCQEVGFYHPDMRRNSPESWLHQGA